MFTLSSLCLPSTSTSTSTSLFLPIAAGRNRHDAKPPRPTRKSPPRRRRGPLPSSRPSSSSSYGSQATTFTRLPRKDDDPSLHTEIPLSHFSLPRFSHLDPPSPSQPEVHIDHDNDDQEEEEIWAFEYEDLAEDEEGKAPDEHGEEEEEANGVKRKEKGLPAVMRCFDRTKIYVKAGGGGNGVVAFRREKYVPHGGPSGGDGGRGGHVYFEVDPSMNSLLPFRKCVHFRAGRGGHGQGSKQRGAAGEGVVVKVPPGTDVRLAAVPRGSGEVLLEMMKPGQRAMLLPGGRGGRGNASFKSALNRVPKIAEYGEEGLDMWLELELKLVADVGIVGAPNAGKSTLLSAISAAQPEIANYPFTTLLPNLGVVSLDFDATMVVADLPGLLEGAHLGYGVGHEFLRHTERCLVLVHVVDGSGEQPEYEFDAVRLELELFNPDLAEKPFIVAYNKMDLPDACARWASFQKHLQDHGIEPFCISAATRMGTQDLVCTTYKLLRKGLDAKKQTEDWAIPMNLNHVAEAVERQRSTPMSDFDIFRDGNTLHVTGAGIQRFIQMTNWEYKQSIRRFLHALEACGVNKALIEAGVKEGDTVIVGEMEMVWHDSSGQLGGNSGMRKQTGSIRWPCL